MASILGLIMFGEVMTAFQLIGGALIVIGGVAQIFFSTKAANDGDVEAGAAISAQVGAGERRDRRHPRRNGSEARSHERGSAEGS